MKFDVRILGKTRTVELQREGSGWRVTLNGVAVDVDAVEIAPNVFSILLNGESHEVRIAVAGDGTLTLQDGHHEFTAEVVDPRAWRGRRHGAVEAEGRQQIVAPMPGKVVRLSFRQAIRLRRGRGCS